MKKIKFLKTGKFSGTPDEPQIHIAKQDVGNYQEVSDTLAKISVDSGVAEYYEEKKKRASPAKQDKQNAEVK